MPPMSSEERGQGKRVAPVTDEVPRAPISPSVPRSAGESMPDDEAGKPSIERTYYTTEEEPREAVEYYGGALMLAFNICAIVALALVFVLCIVPILVRNERGGLAAADEDDLREYWATPTAILHTLFLAFILVNVGFNYYYTTTTPSDNTNKNYDAVVRDLAYATRHQLPRTQEELIEARQAQERWIADRNARLANDPYAKRIPGWLEVGPYDWSFCLHSNQPKPPRSHFDSISRTLVLNFDHWCPWTFNSIGYFNYRYFCNLQIYGLMAGIWGVVTTWRIFFATMAVETEMVDADGPVQDHLPKPRERFYVIFFFVGMAIITGAELVLFSMHAHLIFTGQTTVENQGRSLYTAYGNPYDFGPVRNFQQVYGTTNLLWTFLPSTRLPEFLPVPLKDDMGRAKREKQYTATTVAVSIEAVERRQHSDVV